LGFKEGRLKLRQLKFSRIGKILLKRGLLLRNWVLDLEGLNPSKGGILLGLRREGIWFQFSPFSQKSFPLRFEGLRGGKKEGLLI